MGRAAGQSLLSEALRVIGVALEAHRDETRWREIVARTGQSRGALTFGIGVYDEESQRVVEHCEIRILGSRLEVVEHGRCEWPVDWRVSTEELRRIGARHDASVEAPDDLGLAWLETRLGIAPSVPSTPRP